MTIAELQEKVNKATENVAKIERTIEKHKAARDKKIVALNKILEENKLGFTYDDVKEKNGWFYDYQEQSFYHELYWNKCDISSKDEDIKSATRKLEDAKKVLKNWQEKLRLEEVKIQYIQDSVPQVIKDFLDDWKNRVSKFYKDKQETYEADYAQYKDELNRAYHEAIIEDISLIERKWDLEQFEKEGREYNPDFHYSHIIGYRRRDTLRKPEMIKNEFTNQYDSFFMSFLQHNFDDEWLDKVLTEERNNRLIDLMTRVSKVTGTITDASNLRLKNGNINGYIVGTDGKAQVETIGAGGYNIVCFHYRTLVKPIK